MAGQGANNGPSQAAGNNQFVKFSRGSAQRIAKVVRQIEQGDRGQTALRFEHPVPSASQLKLATVTGQWATGATAAVAFYGVTSTPNTISASNWHLPIEVASGASAECVIGKAGGTWTLLSVNFAKLKAYAAGEVQLLGHTDGNLAQWYSVTTCSTSSGGGGSGGGGSYSNNLLFG